MSFVIFKMKLSIKLKSIISSSILMFFLSPLVVAGVKISTFTGDDILLEEAAQSDDHVNLNVGSGVHIDEIIHYFNKQGYSNINFSSVVYNKSPWNGRPGEITFTPAISM